MTTREDQAVYDAQDAAFEDTPLGDFWDRRSLIEETKEIAGHSWIVPFAGQVTVEESTVRLAHAAAYAQGQVIRFAPNIAQRFVAVHEIAHVVADRCAVQLERPHGPLFRAIFAELAAVVYGERYGQLLRHSFDQLGLPVGPATLPRPDRPIIPIDVLADATREVRWL